MLRGTANFNVFGEGGGGEEVVSGKVRRKKASILDSTISAELLWE